MYIDIEACHVYLRDYKKNQCLNETEVRSLGRAKRRQKAMLEEGHEVSFSVMVDDEEGVLPHEEYILDNIRNELKQHGIVPLTFMLESSLTVFADELINTIRPQALVSNDEGVFLNLGSDDRLLWASEDQRDDRKSIKRLFLESVLNKEDNESYGLSQQEEVELPDVHSQYWIPLKTYRSVEPRNHSCTLLTAIWYLYRLGVEGFRTDTLEKRPNRLVNILPVKYLKSEGFAMEIISLSRATRIRKGAKRIEYIII